MAVVAVYALAVASFFLSIAGILDRLPMGLASGIYVFGYTWLIFFFYAFLLFLCLDLLRLVHCLPRGFLTSSVWGTLLVFGFLLVLLVGGGVHYRHHSS